jgi:hypothetical protein
MWNFHVHAEAANKNANAGSNEMPVVDPSQQHGLWERIRSGPEYLTTMDLILFSCIILLGMELLNHISGNLGRECILFTVQRAGF